MSDTSSPGSPGIKLEEEDDGSHGIKLEEEDDESHGIKLEEEDDGSPVIIIQTVDESEFEEHVVVSEDVAVYETVSALEQLSRGQVIESEDGEMMVYEEVILPEGHDGEVIDVAEVEVGSGRSASPIRIGSLVSQGKKRGKKTPLVESHSITLVEDLSMSPNEAEGDFIICRLCHQLVPFNNVIEHNTTQHMSPDLTCPDCGKLFKSKRSLFGHRKEKHSGIQEVHTCSECGKNFGRKSNLKAHRESLHYGKKFPCSYCERIFTNRSSMNQHLKKLHQEGRSS